MIIGSGTMVIKFFSLPREIIEEIMSYLPPKSLIRFKCVSKSWYVFINALIKNPGFVLKHLRNSNNNIFSPSAYLIFKNNGFFEDPGCEESEDYHGSRFLLLGMFNDRASRFVIEDINLHLIGPGQDDLINMSAHHCDGIICLAYSNRIILCNPSIKEFKLLNPHFSNCHRMKGVGFGYDSRVNDYKVVAFINSYQSYGCVAKVYSLSSDSWKEIKNVPLEYKYSLIPHKETYLNGVCYWLMEDEGRSIVDPNDIILSFDMCDEEFRRIPLPEILQTPIVNCTSLTVWNESVALFFFPGKRGAPLQSIEIWVLVNDCLDGVETSSSLIKQLTINIDHPLVSIACPLAFWKSDELLMKSRTKKQLVSYNLRTKKFRKLNIKVNRISSWVLFYVRSLVSVQAKERT